MKVSKELVKWDEIPMYGFFIVDNDRNWKDYVFQKIHKTENQIFSRCFIHIITPNKISYHAPFCENAWTESMTSLFSVVEISPEYFKKVVKRVAQENMI